jgi:aromatic-amino-acid transaminase
VGSIVTQNPGSALIPAASGRSGDDPIFALNAEATARAQKGESILNATLGALMEDDGTLAIMPSVVDAIARVEPKRAAAYAPILGDAGFLRAVVGDLFDAGPLSTRAVAAATPGGTGAIHHAIVNFLEPGQSVLTAEYFWGPYRTIATHTGRGVETFPMFDARGRFDLESFERALSRQITRQGRALVLLNFPCQNPTGYSLDADEWSGVADIVRRAGEAAPVAFLLDHAYARFGTAESRVWVEHAERMSESAAVLVAWTASKSFAQYGARVGALVAVHPEPKQREAIRAALGFSCRGTWSNCNHLGQLAITTLLVDRELRARAERERDGLVRLLRERVDAFHREAAKTTLRFPRYEGGFFVSVFTPDAERTARAMRAAGIYVVPLAGAVRVALCSTPARDVPRLVEALARGVAE